MASNINISGSNLQGNFAWGDNSVSVSHGDQSMTAKTTAGNFDVLAEELAKHGVEGADLSALRAALAADQHAAELAQKKFGPTVNGWMQKMFGKAIATSWQIEIGVAGSLLASALQRYYGWS
jgi:hypothetical protein